jgi:hypothetical protein
MATHLGDDLIAKLVYTVGKNTPKALVYALFFEGVIPSPA